jgi:hypothetical protein
MKIQIKQIAYHRNGVAGEGFYAILFYPYRKPRELMLASVFHGRGRCSVIRLDLIEEHGVTFGENSWRGDDYEASLRGAIDFWEKSNRKAC